MSAQSPSGSEVMPVRADESIRKDQRFRLALDPVGVQTMSHPSAQHSDTKSGRQTVATYAAAIARMVLDASSISAISVWT
jgi:hypothetical protein